MESSERKKGGRNLKSRVVYMENKKENKISSILYIEDER